LLTRTAGVKDFSQSSDELTSMSALAMFVASGMFQTLQIRRRVWMSGSWGCLSSGSTMNSTASSPPSTIRLAICASAEAALARVQRGLDGRFYKTLEQVQARVAVIVAGPVNDLLQVEASTSKGRLHLSFARRPEAIAQAAARDGIYALATNLPGPPSANKLLRIYKDQSLVEVRHHDLKAPLRVRPLFLHNDDRIEALISIVGLALLVFGLIEADLRRALPPDDVLQGLLPEGRAARPTARNILAAFQGFGLTYAADGIILDRLTATSAGSSNYSTSIYRGPRRLNRYALQTAENGTRGRRRPRPPWRRGNLTRQRAPARVSGLNSTGRG
jgi:hypothetical protein